MHTKRLIFLIIALLITIASHAQTWQELVYLKNGSIIRGTIIEQIPNVSIKIQTVDGSIFAYPMYEVEKITKEQVAAPHERNKRSSNGARYGLPRGYRGFVDLGYTVGFGEYNEGRVELSTSHGYQIMPCFFVGIGIGLHYYYDSDLCEIPVFAHLRGTLPASRVCQPFIDWKIGGTVYDLRGFYTCPSIGCRFKTRGATGVSISVGYTYQTFASSWMEWLEDGGGVTFKFCFDF